MKFYIAVDCEGGACGVGSPGGSLNASPNLDYACLQITREANAAVEALFDLGAEQVIVWDNHSSGVNLTYDLLDERCDIALGQFPKRFPGLDSSFDGLLFIGYHAMDNTPDAVMCHTFSSDAIQWMKVNDREVGELAMDASIAGERGVPPIFVSSDDKGVAEATSFFPGITTVQTKQAFGWNAAISKHPKRVLREIYSGTQQAVQALKQAAPPLFRFPEPFEYEIRFKRIDSVEQALKQNPNWVRTDAHSVRQEIQKMSDIF